VRLALESPDKIYGEAGHPAWTGVTVDLTKTYFWRLAVTVAFLPTPARPARGQARLLRRRALFCEVQPFPPDHPALKKPWCKLQLTPQNAASVLKAVHDPSDGTVDEEPKKENGRK
jgi:hypothetical protein